MLRNEIEISGVAEAQNENSLHLFLQMVVVADMKLSISDVDYVWPVQGPVVQ